MPLEKAYKKAVKDEFDYVEKKGRGKGLKTRLILYLKALIRTLKLMYFYNKKKKKAGVKQWKDLEDFLKKVLSVLR